MSEQAREAVDDYIRSAGKKPGEHLFASPRNPDRPITTRQYARLVGAWIARIESTVRYLGIEVDDALAIAEQVDV